MFQHQNIQNLNQEREVHFNCKSFKIWIFKNKYLFYSQIWKSIYFIPHNYEKQNFFKIFALAWELLKYSKNLDLLGSEFVTERLSNSTDIELPYPIWTFNPTENKDLLPNDFNNFQSDILSNQMLSISMN